MKHDDLRWYFSEQIDFKRLGTKLIFEMVFLEITHAATGKLLKLDAIWLRDHCRCTECYNVETNQRKLNLLDIPSTITPLESNYIKGRLVYEVKWSDGHTSAYDIDHLYESQYERLIERSQKSIKHTPWNRDIVLQNEYNLRVTLSDLVSSDEKVKEVVGNLISYGVAFIDGIPPSTTMTEMAIRRIFPIMKTLFGEMWVFSDTDASHADTAYSKEYIGPHTDNIYFTDAAGVHTLHCIKHTGTGGENFLIDGLYAALELKRRNPHAFQLLSTVHIPGEYIEKGEHHVHSAPIIRVDPVTGEIIQLRYNLYDRATFNTIPQQQMHDFYVCLREFAEILENEQNRWTFKLQPGTLVLYDNWRVLHARHAYTGVRIMTGGYVQRTDYMSKSRILGLID